MGPKPNAKTFKKEEVKEAHKSKPKDLYALPRAEINRSAVKRGKIRLDELKAESDETFKNKKEAEINAVRDKVLNIMKVVA